MKKYTVPVRFTGQHFTIDTILIKDSIRLADIQKDDLVLDIGAGCGFLTTHLTKYSKNVIAIEKDKRLVSELRSQFKSNTNIVIAGIDFRQFVVPSKSFKVVSNIPFGITSEILKTLMYTNFEYFNRGSLIMQLEPARKLIRRKFYNPYTVFYRTFFELELICEINQKSFMPPPTVKSALLTIKKKGAINNIGIESKEKYLSFLYLMLKYPDLPVKTVLKKIFRKKQIKGIAEKYSLPLDRSVCAMTPVHFSSCFVEMLEVVPCKYHPV